MTSFAVGSAPILGTFGILNPWVVELPLGKGIGVLLRGQQDTRPFVGNQTNAFKPGAVSERSRSLPVRATAPVVRRRPVRHPAIASPGTHTGDWMSGFSPVS